MQWAEEEVMGENADTKSGKREQAVEGEDEAGYELLYGEQCLNLLFWLLVKGPLNLNLERRHPVDPFLLEATSLFNVLEGVKHP